ncbi:MAG: FliH/SctL family protein [Bdellovibrionales bacterium]
MPLDKAIIKAGNAGQTTYEYKPKEISLDASAMAKSFVDEDAFRLKDFHVSDLVAQQAGISQLKDEAQRDKINAEVLNQMKEIQEQAYKEGHELGLIEGREQAFQEAKAEMQSNLASLQSALKEIENLKTGLLIDNEEEIVKLVFEISKRLVLKDLEENREAVVNVLKSVIGDLQGDEKITIRLSADDLYFIETLKDKVDSPFDLSDRVRLITDEKIKPGGCLIESEYGTVDATIEERLARAWQTLADRVPQKLDKKSSES